MLKITVTEKSGAQITYQGDQSLIDRLSELGHGLPERPELDAEGNPTGVILPAEYTISIEDITSEHELQQVIMKRKAAYPSPEEFMNAFFDGGDEAIEELRQKRLQIKQLYPKP